MRELVAQAFGHAAHFLDGLDRPLFQQHAGLGQDGRQQGGLGQHGFAHGAHGFRFQQQVAALGHHDRVQHHVGGRPLGQLLGHDLDHRALAQHADLDGVDAHVGFSKKK
ncbi:hypothetical protein G6F57_022019 [Rhizopus arrhizus]|nr:hypothetical protein G6F57_022019 [Rhizopus arrhizus]